MRSDNNSIRIGKTAYLITILVVMLVALLMVVFIARRSQRFSNKRELKKIISCNVQLNELIIPDDWLSTEWYIAEKNQPRTKRDHGVDIETAYFLPTSQNPGSIYQEVIKFPDAYQAWYLFRDAPNFPDSGWVVNEANQTKIANGADQWVTGCIETNHGAIDCALVARYKDVVITLEGRFCTEDFSKDTFFEIAKKIDLIATENITVCKEQ